MQRDSLSTARYIRLRPPAASSADHLNNRMTDGVDGRISDKRNMKFVGRRCTILPFPL